MNWDWSPQQTATLSGVAEWFKKANDQVYYVAGYAGTGKSTMARHFVNMIGGSAVYGAFTGKAAIVMRKNGCEDASTIHSMIYKPNIDTRTGELTFSYNPESVAGEVDLIVIDECSMVDEELGRDLMSFGTPILVLGDPAQLPPVKNAGFFTKRRPNSMLTEIHRQAEGNPIIQLATMARNKTRPPLGRYGSSVVVSKRDVERNESIFVEVDQVMVGKNATRHRLNKKIRALSGREGRYPVDGDRLVCLRNNKKVGIFNGGIFTADGDARTLGKNLVKMSVRSEDFPDALATTHKTRRECFDGGVDKLEWRALKGTDMFDYGYALTVHKSQGSQWGTTMVYDESEVFGDDWWRHLYTGLTRASDRLVLAR